MLRTLTPLPWTESPPTLAASVVIPLRGRAPRLAGMVAALAPVLDAETAGAFEVIVVANGSPADLHEVLDETRALQARHAFVRVEVHPSEDGKGAAVRWGVRASQGDALVFIDADQPFPESDVQTVLRAVLSGAEFVTANRRVPESSFLVPVPLLPLAYRRHRAGQAFNAAVRAALGLRTLDTQAGLKGFSRRFARAAFQRITCPGFLFDIELFMVARAMGIEARELPVEMILRSEASTVRVLRDAAIGSAWLWQIARNERLGRYAVAPAPTPR